MFGIADWEYIVGYKTHSTVILPFAAIGRNGITNFIPASSITIKMFFHDIAVIDELILHIITNDVVTFIGTNLIARFSFPSHDNLSPRVDMDL